MVGVNMKKLIVLIYLFIFFQFSFGAVDIQVSTTTTSVGTPIELYFASDDDETYNIQGIDNSAFKTVGKSQGTVTQIVNGKRSTIVKQELRLLPLQAGNHSIVLLGKNGKIKEITVTVMANGNSQISQQQNTQTNQQQDQQQYENNLQEDNSQQLTQNDLIEKSNLKSSYYLGEKIPYTQSLLLPLNTVDLKPINKLALKDFISKNFTSKMQPIKVAIKGEALIKNPIFVGVLQPIKVGSAKIPSSAYNVILDNGGYFPITIPEKKITVLALPNGAPSNFKNVVGKIQGKIDGLKSGEYKAGDPIEYKVTLYGEGDLSSINTLYEKNNNFSFYENSNNYDEDIRNGKYYNEKSFTVTLIPTTSGKYKIPDIKIPYFNPETKKYEECIIPSNTEITVIGNIKKDDNTASSDIQKEVNSKTTTIKLVKTENTEGERNIYKLITFIISILFVIVLSLLGYFIFKYNKIKNNKK